MTYYRIEWRSDRMRGLAFEYAGTRRRAEEIARAYRGPGTMVRIVRTRGRRSEAVREAIARSEEHYHERYRASRSCEWGV